MLKPKGNRFVHDTGSLLAGVPSLIVGENFTTPLNLEEVRDEASKKSLSLYLEKLEVVEPEPNLVKLVKEKAKELGEDLSEADVAVLALALQVGGTVLSDDYGVLNVASELGIPWKTVRTKGISGKVKWAWYCPNCGKVYDRRLSECPTCGSKLKKRPVTFASKGKAFKRR